MYFIRKLFARKSEVPATQSVMSKEPEKLKKIYLYDYGIYYSEDIIRTMSENIYANVSTLKNEVPSYDEIDNMLMACNYYLENDFIIYKELINNCPDKFMFTYANNSERTPLILDYLRTIDVELANYVLSFTNVINKTTWCERYDLKVNN